MKHIYKLLLIVSVLVCVNTSIVYADVDMSHVSGILGDTYTKPIQYRLNKSPDAIQTNWNTYSACIKLTDIKYPYHSAYYSTKDGIYIDLYDDANPDPDRSSKRKYANLFHEIGHNIGYYMGKAYSDTDDTCISSVYLSDIYGMTLEQMLRHESSTYFKKIRKSTKSNKKAWRLLDEELKYYAPSESYETSDIWDGLSNGKAKAYCGHTFSVKDYWQDHSVGCEAFADMYEASVTNKSGVTLIKKYFPKSYNIFIEICNLKVGE